MRYVLQLSRPYTLGPIYIWQNIPCMTECILNFRPPFLSFLPPHSPPHPHPHPHPPLSARTGHNSRRNWRLIKRQSGLFFPANGDRYLYGPSWTGGQCLARCVYVCVFVCVCECVCVCVMCVSWIFFALSTIGVIIRQQMWRLFQASKHTHTHTHTHTLTHARAHKQTDTRSRLPVNHPSFFAEPLRGVLFQLVGGQKIVEQKHSGDGEGGTFPLAAFGSCILTH